MSKATKTVYETVEVRHPGVTFYLSKEAKESLWQLSNKLRLFNDNELYALMEMIQTALGTDQQKEENQ